jgi:hypothetical protein
LLGALPEVWLAALDIAFLSLKKVLILTLAFLYLLLDFSKIKVEFP